MSKKTQASVSQSVESALKETPEVKSVAAAPPKQVVESLSPQDKLDLDDAKRKINEARDKAQIAALQVQTSELTYNNTILRLALKYGLVDGDLISENGEITRNSK
jgi:hypothetical protein